MKGQLIILFLLFSISIFSLSAGEKYSSIEIEQSLKKLNVLGSVLYIAAHPDDENTALLAWLAKEKLVRTAYLSLTRGGGGQNLIGSEKGDVLSAVRTNELFSARAIDGAEQYFSRGIDFGYSKTTEETLKIWNHKEVLSDIVFVIRKFRPDVIITRFAPNRGGHGHHTASASLAVEAFNLAGDPKVFPEQLKTVKVWSPKRILWNSWAPYIKGADPELKNRLISVNLGKFNPLLGRSYMEISALSRTMHKTQGFGSVPRRGVRIDYFQHLAGSKAGSNLFEDIDMTWKRIDDDFSLKISDMTKMVYIQFDRYKPYKSVPLLLEIFNKLNEQKTSYWIDQKIKDTQELIRLCSGLWIESLSAKDKVVNGKSVDVSVNVLNRSPVNITLDKIEFPLEKRSVNIKKTLKDNIVNKTDVKYLVKNGYLHPYWLKAKSGKGLFNYEQKFVGFNKTPYSYNIKVHLNFSGTKLVFNNPVVYKWRDPVKGEQIEKLIVTPPVTVNFSEKIFYFTKNKTKNINISITGHTKSATGYLVLKAPSGWVVSPKKVKFNLKNISEVQQISLSVTPPEEEKKGELKAFVYIGDKKYNLSNYSVKYDHIQRVDLSPVAKIKLIKTNIDLRLKNIGYIEGSGDDIPKYLEQIGYKVTLINNNELSNGKLNRFDAIITGVRAYNTREVLATTNNRLMEYIKNGGKLLVQYNVSRGLNVKNIGPYKFSLSRRRVTEEDAMVKIINTDSILLNYPNRIRMEQFNNWVQERGLYFADSWDKKYVTVIESHDTGEKENAGGLLYTEYGKGTFIYTGYSFFRQLPAGNDGALKLFVNLIETKKNGK